ncbi:MAG: hypothetical protein IKW63_05195, partial [Elusimicrobiaceae bacterium]|nr:hypothetical protein [Elusimicrobiaceae bacterium]
MKRIIALLLCFSIIFTSVAPLYAQGADAVRAEREAVESFEASFDRAVSEAARAHRTKAGA